ncbi:MAG: 4-alpha-glucanotransferase [Intrasporangium sp.]|uniref:4-alpha-glucanotransferase n=1 Tax=Intrasporangium sp. TaxID=1925024 RepID=UPI00264745E5|nr:4-alpha-glucanotransferase [Intrasporangium sp.]MDN5794501.1 4-alpha-glucanotransferase [Intrasporangium sp.]
MITSHASGVQLHLTSLPDGRLGSSARQFVDWLQAAGQSVWQVLPLSVPDAAGSPYKSPSAFAASPELLEHPDAQVSPEELAAFSEAESYWVGSWAAYGGEVTDQVRFSREWADLRAYARARGVRIMGDIPIYVAPKGADVCAWPSMFRDDAVAGCPPDAYAATGQLWGNPVYRWDVIAADGYAWWVERLRRSFELFDYVRLDHFRGFVDYWEIPAHAETAMEGHWERGPGRALFDAARAELGTLPILAEDLGDIDAAVIDLRRELGLPGMAVLQFGFDPADAANTHHPDHLRTDQVVYTGTHDNDTVIGWWATLPDVPRDMVRAATRATRVSADVDDEPSWALIELALASPCELAMMQAQDVLALGSEARMNTPGIEGGWGWQMDPGALTAAHAQRLRGLTERARRC